MRQLLFAIGPLVLDSLGVIVFAVLLALKVDLLVATAAGALVACAVVGWEIARRRPVQALQWLSLALVVVSGAATVITRDPRFVMAKPTVIYAVVGVAMLKRGWMNRYVPPDELAQVEDLMTRFGYVWAALMFLTGAANLVVAVAFTPAWPTFLAVFPLASKLGLFGFQFLFVRTVARLRSRRLAVSQTAADRARVSA
jgi:intracellular septation protein